MKLIFFILICFVSFNDSRTDEEATVEDDNNVQNAGTSTRNKRFFWNDFRSPGIDKIMQVIGNPYNTQSSTGDGFSFIRDSYPLPKGLTEPYSEYDFVIIGAGSAGSALASRLSKNRNVTVLLLESGKPEMILTDVPALAPILQATDYVWHYYMEPQNGVCMGMNNQRCFWPRGRAVGGTSVVNYMIYTRGRPKDWDRIEADGNYGWSYNDILKYFIALEKSDLKGYEKRPHRGRDGDLPVEFVPIKTSLSNAFLEAGKILGHPTVDYNAPEQLGFGRVQVTISNGRRYSAAKTFLHRHKNRPNLHILPDTTATKILIDPQTKIAYGVEYVHNNLLYTVSTRKEVIVSAGPIASPQLLMLSGIGPQEHLNSIGIPVIHNLPVGRTLYDHICFPGLIYTLNVTDISLIEYKMLNLQNVISWLRHGDSILASPGGVEGIGYIKTPISEDADDSVPDIELINIGGSIVSDGGPGGSEAVRRGMRITESIFDEAFGSIDGTDTWSTFPMLLHPKSFGYLELKDSNPFNHPRLYGNYLTDPRDVATFVAAIRHVQALTATAPFQRYGARIHPAKYKTCRMYTFDSDEYWECAVRTLTATLHHQIATCRMGPVGDPLAVVDPELRVHGIKRLRVVDSSVIPRTISAHTNAPAMAIGLKAADLIKYTWNI